MTQPLQYQQGYRAPALPPPTTTTPSTSVQTSGVGTSTSRGVGQQGTGLQQGRVYTATASPATPDPSVVRGTFLVFSSWASVLIDSGASHSFISASFARALDLETAS